MWLWHDYVQDDVKPCVVINLNNLQYDSALGVKMKSVFTLSWCFLWRKTRKVPFSIWSYSRLLSLSTPCIVRMYTRTDSPEPNTFLTPVTALSPVLWVRAVSQLILYSARHLVYHRPKPGGAFWKAVMSVIPWSHQMMRSAMPFTSVESTYSHKDLFWCLDIHRSLPY